MLIHANTLTFLHANKMSTAERLRGRSGDLHIRVPASYRCSTLETSACSSTSIQKTAVSSQKPAHAEVLEEVLAPAEPAASPPSRQHRSDFFWKLTYYICIYIYVYIHIRTALEPQSEQRRGYMRCGVCVVRRCGSVRSSNQCVCDSLIY